MKKSQSSGMRCLGQCCGLETKEGCGKKGLGRHVCPKVKDTRPMHVDRWIYGQGVLSMPYKSSEGIWKAMGINKMILGYWIPSAHPSFLGMGYAQLAQHCWISDKLSAHPIILGIGCSQPTHHCWVSDMLSWPKILGYPITCQPTQ